MTKNLKYKYVFLGDCNSINIEIICKSLNVLSSNIRYILIGNINDLGKYLKKIKSTVKINEIINPYDFNECKSNYLNIFNVENISKEKYKNLLNQIKLSNLIANKTKKDLITMPINKSIFKKKINFIGMTEYLGKLNNKKTIMLMYGDKFSVVPYTTHINLRLIHSLIKKDKLKSFIELLFKYIEVKNYNLNFKYILCLCYNPHCGESETIGKEDSLITKTFKKYKRISGPFAADSAFKNIKKNSLFIAMYHDQGLIPFKTLNNLGFNLTLGLNYRRISPDHGTAINKKYKNISDNTSYLACMRI